jgi:hypothetical protein
MKSIHTTRAAHGLGSSLVAVALVLGVGGLVVAQEQEPSPAPPLPESAAPSAGADRMQELQAEMVRLFGEIETHLGDVDGALFEASGADTFGDGGSISTWVEGAERDGRAAVEKIDELLDVVDRMQDEMQQQQQQQQQQGGQNQQSSSGQQEQQQSQGQQGQQGQQQSSNPRGQPQNQQSGRENTPEGPSEAGAEQQQRGQENQDGREGPSQEQGATPQNGDENPTDGDNAAAAAAAARAAQRNGGDSAFGAWGELPPRAQEVFTNRASDDMPPKYRDWIDSYYKRVSQQP